jgi:hypothetical protein
MTEHVLYAFERKILRIYGWRCRWNRKIYGLYKDLNIVDDIKIRRLRWAGRIIKMEENRILKGGGILSQKIDSKTKNKMRGRCPEECTASVMNTRLAETNWG